MTSFLTFFLCFFFATFFFVTFLVTGAGAAVVGAALAVGVERVGAAASGARPGVSGSLPPPVTTNAAPATTTAPAASSARGDDSAIPRWSRRLPLTGRTPSAGPSAPADGQHGGVADDGPATGRRQAPRDGLSAC